MAQPALATADSVRTAGNLSTDTAAPTIDDQIARAHTALVKYLGEDSAGLIYDQIYDGAGGYTADNKSTLKLAESDWSMSLLVPVINTATKGAGGITRSVGMGESETQYLSQRESETLASGYMAKAIDAIAVFVAAPLGSAPEDIILFGGLAMAAAPALED